MHIITKEKAFFKFNQCNDKIKTSQKYNSAMNEEFQFYKNLEELAAMQLFTVQWEFADLSINLYKT